MVSNAAIAPAGKLFRDEPVDISQQVMAVNYFGGVILAKAALPHLEKVKGNIVFSSSALGK